MSSAKKLEPTEFLHLSMPAFVDHNTVGELRMRHDFMTARQVCFDYVCTVRMEKSFYTAMHTLKKDLAKANIPMRSINLSLKLRNQMNDHGTFAFINYVSRPKKSLLDVGFLQPFIDNAVYVLKIQANTQVKMHPPYLKRDDNVAKDIAIAGVISIQSQAFMGTISLCFSKQTFLNICFQLFGEMQSEINKEIEDAAGEILNMIFSGAKTELNKTKNYGIEKALPTIIQGEALQVTQSTGATMILPFTSDAGPFHMQIELVTKD